MSEQLLLITHHSSLITFFMSAVPTDETLIIETPERVPLHFALASIGNRFLACAFDHFLQVLLIAIVLLGGYWLKEKIDFVGIFNEAPKWLEALLILLLFVILSSYFVFF